MMRRPSRSPSTSDARSPWERGREAWPELEIHEAVFVAYLEQRAALAKGDDLKHTEAHMEDLYLACGCALGLPAALQRFEDEVLVPTSDYLKREPVSPDFIAEVRQRLRARLLLAGSEGPGKIADYAGRGALRAWVKTALVRTALSLHRENQGANRRLREPDPVPDEPERLNPELACLKADTRAALRESIEAAFLGLSAQQRTQLRLRVCEELSLDELGRIYGGSRAAMLKRLRVIYRLLEARIRQHLTEAHRVDPAQLDEWLALARSQLDLSLKRLLASQSTDP